jgi:hypothetical protein
MALDTQEGDGTIAARTMSEEAVTARRITHWAMFRYDIVNGDQLYTEIYNALHSIRAASK